MVDACHGATTERHAWEQSHFSDIALEAAMGPREEGLGSRAGWCHRRRAAYGAEEVVGRGKRGPEGRRRGRGTC